MNPYKLLDLNCSTVKADIGTASFVLNDKDISAGVHCQSAARACAESVMTGTGEEGLSEECAAAAPRQSCHAVPLCNSTGLQWPAVDLAVRGKQTHLGSPHRK